MRLEFTITKLLELQVNSEVTSGIPKSVNRKGEPDTPSSKKYLEEIVPREIKTEKFLAGRLVGEIYNALNKETEYANGDMKESV